MNRRLIRGVSADARGADLGGALGLADFAAAQRDMGDLVDSARSELLRYRPALSYHPSAAP